MKIGILTLPLHSNYGGLLQAWALQRTIAERGHEVILLNRVNSRQKKSIIRKIGHIVKDELLIAIGKKKRYRKITSELKNLSEKNVIKFRNSRYLGISPELKTDEELTAYTTKNKFQAYIVGSDQVWRPLYCPSIKAYFLNFVKGDKAVKKIAYGASFGVDSWEFSNEETKCAKLLASLFDLITVREDSGVTLVNEHLNCSADQVLDPTLLRNANDYIELIQDSTCNLYNSEGELFCYILDASSKINDTIVACVDKTNLVPFYCNYEIPYKFLEKADDPNKCIVPPVEQWLKSFIDAKLVLTDSYHGMVFSIIFNKPFWIILNKGRGSTRFLSLLKLLHLEERIIENSESVDWNKEIDWKRVNQLKDEMSSFSKTLLFNSI